MTRENPSKLALLLQSNKSLGDQRRVESIWCGPVSVHILFTSAPKTSLNDEDIMLPTPQR
jgi:hypothetical protein